MYIFIVNFIECICNIMGNENKTDWKSKMMLCPINGARFQGDNNSDFHTGTLNELNIKKNHSRIS